MREREPKKRGLQSLEEGNILRRENISKKQKDLEEREREMQKRERGLERDREKDEADESIRKEAET